MSSLAFCFCFVLLVQLIQSHPDIGKGSRGRDDRRDNDRDDDKDRDRDGHGRVIQHPSPGKGGKSNGKSNGKASTPRPPSSVPTPAPTTPPPQDDDTDAVNQDTDAECSYKYDLCLISDESGSITEDNFNLEKAFFAQFASRFTLGADRTRICLIGFSTRPYLRQTLPEGIDRVTTIQKIQAQTYKGTRTQIAGALDVAATEFATNGRPDAIKVAIILTDARQNEDGDPGISADRVRAAGAKVYATGITENVEDQTLLAIAGRTSNMVTLSDYSRLLHEGGKVAHTVCVREQEDMTTTSTMSTTTHVEIPTEPPCDEPDSKADVCLLIDKSLSVGYKNYGLEKDFMARLVANFLVGPLLNRFCLVEFSTQATLTFGLNKYASTPETVAAIKKQQYQGGWTNIAQALDLAGKELKTNGRPLVPQYIVLLTDGVHNQAGNPVTSAAAIKATGVQIFSIGVTNAINKTQLAAISSGPDYVSYSAGFEALASIIGRVQTIVCKTRTPPPPPPVGGGGTTPAPATTQVVTTQIVTTQVPPTTKGPDCTNGPQYFDFCLLIDESESVTRVNYELEKGFLRNFANLFTIGPGKNRFSLTEFSTTAVTRFNLNDYLTNAEVAAHIMSQDYDPNYTNIAAALDLCIPQFTKYGEPNKIKVTILLTDGKHNIPTTDPQDSASRLRATGTTIFSVGVTNEIDRNELVGISGSPDRLYVVPDFVDLVADVMSLRNGVCKLAP